MKKFLISLLLILLSTPGCISTATNKEENLDARTREKVKKLLENLESCENYKSSIDELVNLGSPAVPFLSRKMKSSESKLRFPIVVTLGRIGDPRAVPALIEALKDCDKDVRAKAAEALGEIGDERAVESLVEALEDNYYWVQKFSIKSLVKIGSPSVEHLIRILSHENMFVRDFSAYALGKIADPVSLAPLKEAFATEKCESVKPRLAYALFMIERDESYHRFLIQNLSHKESLVREMAGSGLSGIGEPAVAPLIEVLQCDSKEAREIAAQVLGEIGDKSVIPELLKTLADEDIEIRSAAAEGLINMGKPAVDSLIDALDNKNPQVRCNIAYVLGKIGDSRALGPLISLLEDKASASYIHTDRLINGLMSFCDKLLTSIAGCAALALGETGDDKAAEPLIKALLGEDKVLASYAATALGKLKSKEALEPLIDALNDGDFRLRINSAEALGKIGDKRALEALTAGLKDKNKDVRFMVAQALRNLADKTVTHCLIEALGDQEHYVNRYAMEALVKIGKAAVKPLIAALTSTDSDIRSSAAETLGEIGDSEAVEPLAGLLENTKNRRVIKEAAVALAKLGDKRSYETLLEIMKEDPFCRQQAITALGHLGDRRATGHLLVFLKDENEWIRRYAAESLGRIGDKKAVEPLIGAMRDKEIMVASATAAALARIGDKKAVEPMIEALGVSKNPFQSDIPEALQKLTGQYFGTSYKRWKNWYENQGGR